MRRCIAQTRHTHHNGPKAVTANVCDLNACRVQQRGQHLRAAKIAKDVANVIDAAAVHGLKRIAQHNQQADNRPAARKPLAQRWHDGIYKRAVQQKFKNADTVPQRLIRNNGIVQNMQPQKDKTQCKQPCNA